MTVQIALAEQERQRLLELRTQRIANYVAELGSPGFAQAILKKFSGQREPSPAQLPSASSANSAVANGNAEVAESAEEKQVP